MGAHSRTLGNSVRTRTPRRGNGKKRGGNGYGTGQDGMGWDGMGWGDPYKTRTCAPSRGFPILTHGSTFLRACTHALAHSTHARTPLSTCASESEQFLLDATRNGSQSNGCASSLFRVLATIPFNANSQEDKWRRFFPPRIYHLACRLLHVQLLFFRRSSSSLLLLLLHPRTASFVREERDRSCA